MKAIFNENTVDQILTPVDGFDLKDCFHKDVLKTAADVPDYVSVGCVLQDDGTWLDAQGVLIEASVQAEEPAVEEIIEETVVEEPVVEEPVVEEPVEETTTDV